MSRGTRSEDVDGGYLDQNLPTIRVGIGLKARDLARDLRDRYKLPQRDYSRYDPGGRARCGLPKEDEMRTRGATIAKRLTAKFQAAEDREGEG